MGRIISVGQLNQTSIDKRYVLKSLRESDVAILAMLIGLQKLCQGNGSPAFCILPFAELRGFVDLNY